MSRIFVAAFLSSLLSFAPAYSAEVPDFSGLTEQEAANKARDLGFSPTVIETSSAERLGRVFSQIPAEGTDMDGGEILLRVSSGRVVPPIRMRSIEEVSRELEELGIGWIASERAELGVSPGLVSRSEPSEGAVVDASEQVVFLTVSNTELVEIPDLVGEGFGASVSRLTDLGLSVSEGTETVVSSEPIPNAHWRCVDQIKRATVAAMEPGAGKSVPVGSSITVSSNVTISYMVEPCTDNGTRL